MKLQHSFAVPVPVAQAWNVLLDIERLAPCMPGATIETVSDDSFTGKIKVKVGPITVGYSGSASFIEKDADARRVVLSAKGRETRGAGTAAATITASLADSGGDDDDTLVSVVTDLSITGRPAQFGRGVMSDVGAKLLGQFADCLSAELTETPPELAEPAATTMDTQESDALPPRTAPAKAPLPQSEPINLMKLAGGSVLRRVGIPLLAVIVLVAILIVILAAG
jgi:carbon monoxide dehydrogenase subunit G